MVQQDRPQLQPPECSRQGQCSDAGSGPAHGVTAAMAARAAPVVFTPKMCHFEGKGLSIRPLSASHQPHRDETSICSSVTIQKPALYSDHLPAKCVGYREKKDFLEDF